MDKKDINKREFKKAMKKDANLSMFVFGPFFLMIYILIAFNSDWPKILSIVFSILVLLVTFFVFYYSNIIKRGELMQKVVKEIEFRGNMVHIKSFDWYFKKTIEYQFKKSEIKSVDKEINLLKYKGLKIRTQIKTELILIPDLFENWDEIIPQLVQVYNEI